MHHCKSCEQTKEDSISLLSMLAKVLKHNSHLVSEFIWREV